MIGLELLEKKEIVDGKLDLLSNIVIIDYDKISIDEWILVDEFSVMGLDYVSESLYGSNEYVWVLMKFNRIDSPFEVNVGDIIAIPNINEFRQNTKVINYKSITTTMLSKQNNAFNKSINNIGQRTSNITQKTTPISNFTKQSGNVIF